MHYDNSDDVNLDTFNYIMNIAKNQCDHYHNGKINNDKKINECIYNTSHIMRF